MDAITEKRIFDYLKIFPLIHKIKLLTQRIKYLELIEMGESPARAKYLSCVDYVH